MAAARNLKIQAEWDPLVAMGMAVCTASDRITGRYGIHPLVLPRQTPSILATIVFHTQRSDRISCHTSQDRSHRASVRRHWPAKVAPFLA